MLTQLLTMTTTQKFPSLRRYSTLVSNMEGSGSRTAGGVRRRGGVREERRGGDTPRGGSRDDGLAELSDSEEVLRGEGEREGGGGLTAAGK